MIRTFTPTTYRISSRRCSFDDDGTMLCDNGESSDALLRTDYKISQIRPRRSDGIYRYGDWLPVRHRLQNTAAPVVWKSRQLARAVGLRELYIVFNGWFPRRGAKMTTCSFKETEAYAVCSRFRSDEGRVLVVASAGNTARAFAKVCSDNRIPLLLCVPEDNIGALWFAEKPNDCVKLISTPRGSDYYDAIELSRKLECCSRFVPEGGARNVARRDGMGTSFVAAAVASGRIPDYYFQAVGSGTGAIAAWEANSRLVADGRFGGHFARLMLSQNAPFTPIVEAWAARSKSFNTMEAECSRRLAQAVEAKVLTNRCPPYSVGGGLFDVLSAAGGEVAAITNCELAKARYLFASAEGIDIAPAAGVTVASLLKAVGKGSVEPDKTIVLNITGGGEECFKQGRKLHYLEPDCLFDVTVDSYEVVEKTARLYPIPHKRKL